MDKCSDELFIADQPPAIFRLSDNSTMLPVVPAINSTRHPKPQHSQGKGFPAPDSKDRTTDSSSPELTLSILRF